uniref:DNA nucleotidylexotransferase n=1 Tax=Pundamilia nyererei TaxID=303518 RepID=A0A3B4FC33_9CICH
MFHTPIVPRARKRSRPAEASAPRRERVKFEDVRLYLVERKMGRSRRSFLTELARSKGFIVEDVLSDVVTHVVSEDSQASSLWAWLKGGPVKNLPVIACLVHASPVIFFCTQDTLAASPEATTPTPMSTVSQYACQRRTTTKNNNKIFTDAFEVLAESHEFNDMEGPCLAFRRAASVLKSLPWTVQNLRVTEDLPCLGEHSMCVIEEILQHGHSFEVEKILSDERTHPIFTLPLIHSDSPTNNHVVFFPAGFLHYGDISRAVSKAEAQALGNIIDEAVRAITPDAILTLTGGFRRGKDFGHDVDFIVTTPQLGKEERLLTSVIDRLKQQGILLYCEYQASTFDESKLPSHRFEAMDHFAKCFLILRLEDSQVEGGLQTAEEDRRGWRAVRVDLVSPPVDRYAFTLLGWSGSRQFERDLRRFARMERRMLLDNHALYDKTKKEFLAATTEKDIFAHLGLEYIEPWQRNA